MDRTPHELAAELAAFCDTLLPGSDRFPSASAVGAHGVAVDRIRALAGTAALEQLKAALNDCGGPLAAAGPTDRPAIVTHLEAEHPALFGLVRLAIYTAYYESPAVIAAVRGLGLDYNDAPQPQGYQLAPFDPTDALNAPAHRRGVYVATDQVRRVDMSALPQDPLAPERIGVEVGSATGRGLLSSGTRAEVDSR